jgi:hypothetical protein
VQLNTRRCRLKTHHLTLSFATYSLVMKNQLEACMRGCVREVSAKRCEYSMLDYAKRDNAARVEAGSTRVASYTHRLFPCTSPSTKGVSS